MFEPILNMPAEHLEPLRAGRSIKLPSRMM